VGICLRGLTDRKFSPLFFLNLLAKLFSCILTKNLGISLKPGINRINLEISKCQNTLAIYPILFWKNKHFGPVPGWISLISLLTGGIAHSGYNLSDILHMLILYDNKGHSKLEVPPRRRLDLGK